MDHQTHLNSGVCNHLRGEGFDAFTCQEIQRTLGLFVVVKLCACLCQVGLCGSMIAEDTKCDLWGWLVSGLWVVG